MVVGPHFIHLPSKLFDFGLKYFIFFNYIFELLSYQL